MKMWRERLPDPPVLLGKFEHGYDDVIELNKFDGFVPNELPRQVPK
jgi:hypothetical protein